MNSGASPGVEVTSLVPEIVLNGKTWGPRGAPETRRVRTMMWGWGAGWWVLGAAFMVFCMVMMLRMMAGHGHSGHGGSDHGTSDDRGGMDAERALADRLARGEIDTEEYIRILETLRGAGHSTHT
jgi:uncharacterized membrane protein